MMGLFEGWNRKNAPYKIVEKGRSSGRSPTAKQHIIIS